MVNFFKIIKLFDNFQRSIWGMEESSRDDSNKLRLGCMSPVFENIAGANRRHYEAAVNRKPNIGEQSQEPKSMRGKAHPRNATVKFYPEGVVLSSPMLYVCI